VYEEQFDAFAEGVAGIPKLLETVCPALSLSSFITNTDASSMQGSEAPVKKTDIIKRFGTLHTFRQKLNLEDENLLDEPEFLWEDADLHAHYTAVCNALEFESRLTCVLSIHFPLFPSSSSLPHLLAFPLSPHTICRSLPRTKSLRSSCETDPSLLAEP
jgi:hypothetical protein